MKTKALLTVIKVATEDIEVRPLETQLRIYDALSQLLPNEEERLLARRVAFSIRETTELQRNFNQGLQITLASISAPAHKPPTQNETLSAHNPSADTPG